MNEASQVAEQDAVLLQLAAGGFRDMTRIAAGDPGIWPDILFENRDAVVQSLEALEARLQGLRKALLDDGRDVILDESAERRECSSTATGPRAEYRRPRLPAREGQ